MVRWSPAVRAFIVGAVLASHSAVVAAADPLVLFLLRMLRDQVISSAIESGVEAARKRSKEAETAAAFAPPRSAPQPATEGQWLKGLIDESFVHLGAQQREELHASLMKILGDPRHAAQRGEILAEFTRQAVAMRDAHRALSRLTPEQMQAIAQEARQEYERLPADQREHLRKALEQGVPGVPRALNERMLAEFSGVASAR